MVLHTARPSGTWVPPQCGANMVGGPPQVGPAPNRVGHSSSLQSWGRIMIHWLNAAKEGSGPLPVQHGECYFKFFVARLCLSLSLSLSLSVSGPGQSDCQGPTFPGCASGPGGTEQL
jgi:hypothetical protein